MKARSDSGAEARGQSGFALLLVIWVLGLLAVFAAGIAALVQSEAKIARNRVELARARAFSEAGVALAINALLRPDFTARWHQADGNPHTILYAGASIAVTVQDEAGKIDINSAPIEIIQNILNEFSIADEGDRDAVLREIVQRRASATEGKLVSLSSSGTSGTPLPAAGTHPLAFATVSELRQLSGMPRTVYEKLRPFLTVYSKQATVNPLTAPLEVLAALPGIVPEAVDAYVAARVTQPLPQVIATLPSLGSQAASYLASTDVNVVTIIARAETAAGISFNREAVVELGAGARTPFTLLAWRPG